MQTIKTTENSDEQPVVYDLTELLGYSRPGDLMKITAALYSDSISNRLNGIGKLLSDEPKWGETLRSFNPAKTEQLEHAIEGGLVDICEGKSDQIKDLMVEYTISPVAEGGVPALEVLKELQSNGLFEYTGDKTQDTIIVKAALKSSNPVNFLQLIKKIDGEGLFGFDEDVQPQVLNFVLNNADPEKALSSVQRLNSLNGFLVDARRTYKKSDDGALQEYSLDIPFMAHPLEWLKLLDSVPDGPKGEAIRQKILDRLFLPYKMSNLEQGAFDYNEDPVQAIRVFTDILPTSNDERNAQLQPYQINLLRLLAAAGQDTAVTGAEGQITGYRGFPSNPSKLRNVLFDEASIDVYSQLYAAKIGGEETLRGFLGDHPDVGEPAVYSQADLPKLLGELRTMVDYYRKEPGVARAWINQYATEPIKAAKVVSAWQSRALALTYRDAEDPGLRVADNPKAILDFVASHGVRILAESRITTGTTTLTGDDIRGLRGWIESIGSRYAPTITLQALEKVASYKKEHGAYPRKLITAGQTNVAIKVSDAEDGADQERRVRNETFNAAVLGPDDAGGFTIGYDTGCCMTLKGASESCIWAGYEDPRYSFFTVRDSGGRLRAQSILYLAEEMGKKYLVADNIEINEGTDVTKIAEVYKTALLDILDQNNVEVDAIHIGTGFVHKDILGNLPSAETAPQTPLKGTYTDALNQRVLWSKD